MNNLTDTTIQSLQASFLRGQKNTVPYTHWFLNDCLPPALLDDVVNLPIDAPDIGDQSGTRELHNATRVYFDEANNSSHSCCGALASALQSRQITNTISDVFNVNLHGTCLRIEYAQDTGKFWLEPHSDIGVKVFTLLIYLAAEESSENLGTDIYDANKKPVGRAPFEANNALVFVPASNTFHGFEPRVIKGIRKSLVVNYVTDEWRAREQLAFPEQPI